jgi:hypothetical protein
MSQLTPSTLSNRSRPKHTRLSVSWLPLQTSIHCMCCTGGSLMTVALYRLHRIADDKIVSATSQWERCSQRLMSGLNSWKTLMPASTRIVSDPATKIAVPLWYWLGHQMRETAAAP